LNVFTESYMYMDQSAFQYDYETLRTTGVILAVVIVKKIKNKKWQ
uniref:FXYD domain-containing ion transport regulator n=1 Tax=Cyprinus carpio carpio TaxID=630221 RepID=A0A9J8CAQ5_CYPCA